MLGGLRFPESSDFSLALCVSLQASDVPRTGAKAVCLNLPAPALHPRSDFKGCSQVSRSLLGRAKGWAPDCY